jgi:hypothetical protein
MNIEIVEKENKIELILKKVGKVFLAIATLLNKLLLHSLLHFASLFERDVEYGGGAVDNEILERISYDKEQNEFQNNSE